MDELVSFDIGRDLHGSAGLFHLPFDVADLASSQDAFKSCLVPITANIDLLREVPDRTGTCHRADRGLCITGKDPQESCLSCAVWTDQADLIAWLDRERHIGQERAHPCGDGHISHEQHASTFGREDVNDTDSRYFRYDAARHLVSVEAT